MDGDGEKGPRRGNAPLDSGNQIRNYVLTIKIAPYLLLINNDIIELYISSIYIPKIKCYDYIGIKLCWCQQVFAVLVGNLGLEMICYYNKEVCI